MRDLKLGIYVDRRGRWRWRVCAGNGRIIARSPGSYVDEGACRKDVRHLVSEPRDAELYLDRRGEWRWRYVHARRILAVASEGYANRGDCKRSSDLFLDAWPRVMP
jgi:uncharacterized protein YegP (UPF0339 family)